MTEGLKSAIRTIAEYDGWVFYQKLHGVDMFKHPSNPSAYGLEVMEYHTSADALLPVWRKVRDQLKETDEWSYEYGKMYDILKMVGFDELSSACLKLSQIISQLNEQK